MLPKAVKVSCSYRIFGRITLPTSCLVKIFENLKVVKEPFLYFAGNIEKLFQPDLCLV